MKFNSLHYSKQLILFFVFYFIASSVYAQDRRFIRSHENMIRLEKQDPKIAKERQRIEDKADKDIFHVNYNKNTVIPIVFHVISNKANNRISESDVLNQLDALNEHFQSFNGSIDHAAMQGEKFDQRYATIDLQFCLADLDKGNKKVEAITFNDSDQMWSFNDDMKDRKTGGVDAVSPKNYLNIWVVNLDNGVSGYAQMPGGPDQSDGIVIDFDFFGIKSDGSRFSEGKTLTHLVGNYLGLHSLWGETRCADDYVKDTPIHNAPNYNCPEYKHYSTCDGNPIEMTMNFMDNSNDECLKMFTAGQRQRIHSFLQPSGARANLLNGKSRCSEEEDVVELNAKNEDFESDVIPNFDERIDVFPNPTSGDINVSWSFENNGEVKLRALSISGQVMKLINVGDSETGQSSFDTFSWPRGLYFIEISQKDEVKKIEKIVVSF